MPMYLKLENLHVALLQFVTLGGCRPGSQSTLFPGSLILPSPRSLQGGGNMRDPGNEVGSQSKFDSMK